MENCCSHSSNIFRSISSHNSRNTGNNSNVHNISSIIDSPIHSQKSSSSHSVSSMGSDNSADNTQRENNIIVRTSPEKEYTITLAR